MSAASVTGYRVAAQRRAGVAVVFYDLASGCHRPEGNERPINLRSGRVLLHQPLHEDGVIVPLTDFRMRGTARRL